MPEVWQNDLSAPEGFMAGPLGSEPVGAMLVLSGSSGRVERERALLLARNGVVAFSFRWFGDTGQSPGICEIPLESFDSALIRLGFYSDQLAILGVSKGAEAALLIGAYNPAVTAVIALSPTSVVWANLGAGSDGADRPLRSSWMAAGSPLPFVPYDEAWSPPAGVGAPAYRGLYEQSLAMFADQVPDATIPVEHIAGRVIVSGGGDDQVWPSDRFAQEISLRRAAHGLETELIIGKGAGHRLLFPGEVPTTGGSAMARGGSTKEDTELGTRVWTAMEKILALQPID